MANIELPPIKTGLYCKKCKSDKLDVLGINIKCTVCKEVYTGRFDKNAKKNIGPWVAKDGSVLGHLSLLGCCKKR